MSATAYVEAAMVACPRCSATVGKPCRVGACRNGYRDCTYRVCFYWKELDAPHLERSVLAKQATDADRRADAELRDRLTALDDATTERVLGRLLTEVPDLHRDLLRNASEIDPDAVNDALRAEGAMP